MSDMKNRGELTPKEAFKIWHKAYTANYDGTGLCEGEILAEQSWQAALNYAEQSTPKPDTLKNSESINIETKDSDSVNEAKTDEGQEAKIREYLRNSNTFGDRERHEMGQAIRVFAKYGEAKGWKAAMEFYRRFHQMTGMTEYAWLEEAKKLGIKL